MQELLLNILAIQMYSPYKSYSMATHMQLKQMQKTTQLSVAKGLK